jgi:hypothetical protein
MSANESMADKAKERLNEFRASLEHLNVQMHLGATEARDEYEKQKKNLAQWIEQTSRTLGEMKDVSKEKATELKGALDDLRVQAALGRAEGKEAFQEQQKKIMDAMSNAKKTISGLYESTEEGVKDFADRAEHKLEDYHTRLDMLRLKAHLGKEDLEDAWEERSKKLSYQIQELTHKIDLQKEKAEEGWSHFSKEMKTSWSHLRKAFGGSDA